MKQYRHIEGNNHLKIEVYYNKGGMNYFSGNTDKRGYWLSVIKVEREQSPMGYTTESFTVFSGGNRRMFLHEVKRQSDKAYTQAVEIAKGKIDELCEVVLAGSR
jgi:hypothetical protein